MAKGITLIGMPGSGKSTIGRLLAGRLGFTFVDLDNLIRDKEGKTHAQIAREKGDAELSRLEEFYTLGLNFENTVFAPGGSIVYSSGAMEKLRRDTEIIYLKLPLAEIGSRLSGNLETRGIVGLKEKGLDGLFAERSVLYEKFAHWSVNCSGLSEDQIIDIILMFLRTLE